MKNLFIGIVVVLIAFVISYLIVAAVVWGICWAFGLTFTYKAVVGVYLIIILLNIAFGGKR